MRIYLRSLHFSAGIRLHFLLLGTYAIAQLLDLTTPNPRLMQIQLVQVQKYLSNANLLTISSLLVCAKIEVIVDLLRISLQGFIFTFFCWVEASHVIAQFLDLTTPSPRLMQT